MSWTIYFLQPIRYTLLMERYDSLIIGGGPAGLSAAIYLARFQRTVLVLDTSLGRSSHQQINENYLGFPDGIKARDLRTLGEQQAKRFGAQFITDEITGIIKSEDGFIAHSLKNKYFGKTVILATGVIDLFPQFKHLEEYIGKSLFWCITCDGYKTRNKRVVVVGHTDEAVVTCLQFLNYTDKLTFVLNCGIEQAEISEKMKARLAKHTISYNEGVIKDVKGKDGFMTEVILEDDTKINADFIFNQQEATPNNILAQHLGVISNDKGYIMVGDEQRTNIPYVYAAGDVTKPFSHQIASAVHEGSMAAQAANYDLYEPYQRD